jgi:hypothetical protein
MESKELVKRWYAKLMIAWCYLNEIICRVIVIAYLTIKVWVLLLFLFLFFN